MSELIFVIIVIAIIVSKVKAQNQGTKRGNTTYINGKPVDNQKQRSNTASYGAGYNRPAQASYNRPTQPAYAKKERLSKSEQEKLKSDILSRAKKNVKENDADVLKQMDMMQHEAARGIADIPAMSVSQTVAMEKTKPVGNQITSELDEDCDIMKTLNDLMIMGYSGNLEFDRDFVAEGVDMLNSYMELGM